MRKCFNKFEKILKTLRKILLQFKKLFRKIEKILLIFNFFRKYVTFRINMKYYCVLEKNCKFWNFYWHFWQTFKKDLEVLEIFNKMCKNINKNLNFPLPRGLLNKTILGPFRPVRPAGLDFQARPAGRPARCHL